MQPDVFVIGGGPAGLAAAIAARHKGFRVTVADSRHPPIDKACGEGLMPEMVRAARRMGVDLRQMEAVSIRGVRFSGDGVSVASSFPNGWGCGVRRTALHAALILEAENCGVELQWDRPLADFGKIHARWIVGADGSGSRVRSWAGLDSFTRNTCRFGFRQHYGLAPWTDHIEIFWADATQVYATPVGRSELGIAVLSSDPKLRVNEALTRFPELMDRLAGAPVTSVERGGITASRRLRKVTRGNVALVGDAAGSVDAITAEGLSLAFRQALALADAMESGDLSRYESAHARMARRPRFMADLMLTMDRWPWVRRRALHAMAARPRLFSGFLAMHVGESGPSEFAVICAALGWRMLGA